VVFLGNIMINRKYRVRWRFDFHGKPTKRGIWNDAGGSQDEKFGTSAWATNKDGLARAVVEGEVWDDKGGWSDRIVCLAECDGADFVNFSWQAATPVPYLSTLDAMRGLTMSGQIVGLTLETRDHLHQVYVDGSKFIKTKTEADKAIHLAGFGK
jgi:hypothetical protein